VTQRDWPRFMVRLPHDVKQFLALQSRRNGASQNSEIIRSVRERMDREYIREPLGPQK
jgi:hypothetical protein